MSDILNFMECLASGILWVYKNQKLRHAKIIECHFDRYKEEKEPNEKYFIEYFDDQSNDMVYPNECTFVYKFALQHVIKEIKANIACLQKELSVYETEMVRAGGPTQCIRIVMNSTEPSSSMSRDCFGQYNSMQNFCKYGCSEGYCCKANTKMPK